jgi:predicted RNase H-like nuclease (RuvC/YqgF family)
MIVIAFMEMQILAQQTADAGIQFKDTVPYLFATSIGGVLTYALKAVIDRKSISAVARKEEATAADIVAGAAAELINPLRAELATTRGEVIQLRTELAANTAEMHQLTVALEKQSIRNKNLEGRNTELERENAELHESCKQNDELKLRNTELERENAELQERLSNGNA